MSFFHHIEILILGKRASKINKVLREKNDKLDELISLIEDEKLPSQPKSFSEANSEEEKSKTEFKSASKFSKLN